MIAILTEHTRRRGRFKKSQTLQGVIHGKIIELSIDPGLTDGEAIQVLIETAATPSRGERLARCAGALADDPYWDDIMEEIQDSRKLERRSQELGQ